MCVNLFIEVNWDLHEPRAREGRRKCLARAEIGPNRLRDIVLWSSAEIGGESISQNVKHPVCKLLDLGPTAAGRRNGNITLNSHQFGA